MSRHLRVLRASGLVEAEFAEDDGRARVYRLRPERLRALNEWLESFWGGQLDAFKAHADRKR